MSVTPKPDEITAPRDPAAYRRPRLMGPGFWAMLALCMVCVAAGAGFAVFAPRLLANRPMPSPLLDLAPVADSAPKPKTAAAPAPLSTPAAPAAPVEGGGLDSRIAALEDRQERTAQAAATALAASALVQVSITSRPFTEELSVLEGLAPPSADLASLRRLAETGAPSRAALTTTFPDYASRAASASRAPGEGAGVLARAGYALSRIVTVRRVGDVQGTGADAVLARAEHQVEDGELDAALKTLDSLSPAARDAMAPWRARAERRAEIDRRVAAIRVQALEAVARLSRSGG